MKRTVLGSIALGLGVCLVLVAVLIQTWGADQLKKTPLDVDSVTRTAGEATSYTGGAINPYTIKAETVTKVDTEASEAEGDDTAVFRTFACIVKDLGDVGDCVPDDDPQNRLVTASFEDFATDRYTAMAVDSDALGKPACEGLMNKWPFDTEKKDYPYCTTTGVTNAVYDGTEDISGLETYRFKINVDPSPAEIVEGVEGLYSEQTTIWVEPLTGQFVKVDTAQQRALSETEKALDFHVVYTDEQIAENVDDIGGDRDLLKLATSTVPLVGYAVGIPLMLIGLALLLLRRSSGGGGGSASHRDRELVKA